MNIFFSILMLLVSVLITLLIHELGHFLFAVLFNVNVKEFSIGVGPIIYKKISYKSGTQFSFRIFPIAAYVSLDTLRSREIVKEFPGSKNYNLWMKPKKRGKSFFEDISFWKMVVVILAGVIFNLAFFSMFFPILITISPHFYLFDHIKGFFINIGNFFCFGQLVGNDNYLDTLTNLVSYEQILTYIILMNFSVGIFNVLPLPLFDGYRFLVIIYEKVSRKKISQKANTVLSLISFFILAWFIIGEIVVFSL